jgi:cell division protein ZapA
MEKTKKNITEVEIHGEIYKIVNDAPQEYTLSLAKFVDEKLKEISQNTSLAVPMKVAILAALNIADELFKLKEELDTNNEIIAKETESLCRLIQDNTRP